MSGRTVPVTEVTVGQVVYGTSTPGPDEVPYEVTDVRPRGDWMYLTFSDGCTVGYPLRSSRGVPSLALAEPSSGIV